MAEHDHVAQISCLYRKLQNALALSPREHQQLDRLQRHQRTVSKGERIWRHAERLGNLYIVIDGWAAVYAELPNGTSQIISVRIPGDIIGLFSPVRPRHWYSVRALTEMRLSPGGLKGILQMTRRYPRLLATLGWIGAHDEIFLCEQIVRLGRHSAYLRIGRLLTELAARCEMVGISYSGEFFLPLNQEHIADALGLSVVHANRTLRTLMAEGLVELGRSRIRVHDLQALAVAVDFDLEAFRFEPLPPEIQQMAS